LKRWLQNAQVIFVFVSVTMWDRVLIQNELQV